MDWLANPEIWIALLTLTALEIVLGIDNIIFISFLTHQTQRAKGALERMLHENPLAVGALALGAAAAVGLAVPESSKESQMMGQARDSLVEEAQ